MHDLTLTFRVGRVRRVAVTFQLTNGRPPQVGNAPADFRGASILKLKNGVTRSPEIQEAVNVRGVFDGNSV